MPRDLTAGAALGKLEIFLATETPPPKYSTISESATTELGAQRQRENRRRVVEATATWSAGGEVESGKEILRSARTVHPTRD